MIIKNISYPVLLSIILTSFYPSLQSEKPAHIFLLTGNKTKFEKKFLSEVEKKSPFYQQCHCLPVAKTAYTHKPGKIYSKLEKIILKHKQQSQKNIVLHAFNLDAAPVLNRSSANQNFTQFGNYATAIKKLSNLALTLAQTITKIFNENKESQFVFCCISQAGKNITELLYQMLNPDIVAIQIKQIDQIQKSDMGWPGQTYDNSELTSRIFHLDIDENMKDKKIIKRIKAKMIFPSASPQVIEATVNLM